MTTADPDPLESLLMDGAEVDRARIAGAISDLIGIDRTTSSVRPRGPAYRNLNNREKLLATLLGIKAASLMKVRDDEAVKPSELPGLTGLPDGSVASTLKLLRDNHLVSQTKNGSYFLSDPDVLAAVEALESRDRESSSKSGGGTVRPRRKRKKSDGATSKQANGVAKTAKKQGSGEGESQKKASKGRSSGFSPTNAVREMIGDGWFDSPRGLSDVQGRIRDTMARTVPLENLSPVFARLVRSGELTRSRNSDGNYEYMTPESDG